jgi:hypothetical protein
VPPKFDISIVMSPNMGVEFMEFLEPYCNNLYTYLSYDQINEYVAKEQANTLFDIRGKVWRIEDATPDDEIIVRFTGWTENTPNIINELSSILDGSFEDIRKDQKGETFTVSDGVVIEINTNRVQTYEKNLINCERKQNYF